MTEAKVPAGMTIEKPKEEVREVHNPNPAVHVKTDFYVDPGLPQIVFPHYINNDKTMLACVLVRPDGNTHKEDNIPKDSSHPVYRDIKKQFDESEILANTKKQANHVRLAQEVEASNRKDEADSKQRQDLWEAKQAYLKLPAVVEFKSFKRMIRKSQTVIEAQAYAIGAILKAHENEDGE